MSAVLVTGCTAVAGDEAAVNADKTGTKCAAVHCFTLQPHCQAVVRSRLRHVSSVVDSAFSKQFDSVLSARRHECNEFYSEVSCMMC